MAAKVLGPSPQDLGVFTSVLAAGSITGGVVLRHWSDWISHRPGLLMGACTAITALAQLGMAVSIHPAMSLAMTFVIGAGTAALLTGVNLIGQVGAPMVLRGRMAGMGQIAFLGGGGIGGLMAGLLTQRIGLLPTFALLGSIGLVLGLAELVRHGSLRIQAVRSA
jgi:MFS family permease